MANEVRFRNWGRNRPWWFWRAMSNRRARLAGDGEPVEPTVPAQFSSGAWSVADAGTSGDIVITITSLPSNGGSAITNLEYQIEGGAWVSLASATTGSYPVAGLTDNVEIDVALRAVNAVGQGVASTTKPVTPTLAPTVPAQFTAGNWSIADATTGGAVTITISALPSNGGSAITALQYQVEGGSWVALSGVTTGAYPVTGLTNGVEVDVAIRAVNAVGAGTASATKAVTPSLVLPVPVVTWASDGEDATPDFSFTMPPSIVAGDVSYAEVSPAGAGTWATYYDHTFTAPEIASGTVTVSGVTPLADGAWDFRFRFERGATLGGWSATVAVTLGIPASAWLGAVVDTGSKGTGLSYSGGVLNGVSIGTPHAQRELLIVVACNVTNGLGVPTFGGVAATLVIEETALFRTSLYRLPTAGTALDAATTANIVVLNDSGNTVGWCLVGLAVAYPATAAPVESNQHPNISATTNAVVSNLDLVTGGIVFYAGQQYITTAGTLTMTSSGVNAPVDGYNAQTDASGGANVVAGIIKPTETASRNLTLAVGTTGTKTLLAMSFGAP